MPQPTPSSTGNAEAIDLDHSALSTTEESQRTENDVAPIADDTVSLPYARSAEWTPTQNCVALHPFTWYSVS